MNRTVRSRRSKVGEQIIIIIGNLQVILHKVALSVHKTYGDKVNMQLMLKNVRRISIIQALNYSNMELRAENKVKALLMLYNSF